MRLLYDNQATISIVQIYPVHHDHTKHVEINQYFIKAKIVSEPISLQHT